MDVGHYALRARPENFRGRVSPGQSQGGRAGSTVATTRSARVESEDGSGWDSHGRSNCRLSGRGSGYGIRVIEVGVRVGRLGVTLSLAESDLEVGSPGWSWYDRQKTRVYESDDRPALQRLGEMAAKDTDFCDYCGGAEVRAIPKETGPASGAAMSRAARAVRRSAARRQAREIRRREHIVQEAFDGYLDAVVDRLVAAGVKDTVAIEAVFNAVDLLGEEGELPPFPEGRVSYDVMATWLVAAADYGFADFMAEAVCS